MSSNTVVGKADVVASILCADGAEVKRLVLIEGSISEPQLHTALAQSSTSVFADLTVPMVKHRLRAFGQCIQRADPRTSNIHLPVWRQRHLDAVTGTSRAACGTVAQGKFAGVALSWVSVGLGESFVGTVNRSWLS